MWLTELDVQILLWLHQHGIGGNSCAPSISVLSKRLGRGYVATHKHVMWLHRLGLLRAKKVGKSRRVSLTPLGRRVADRLAEVYSVLNSPSPPTPQSRPRRGLSPP